MAINETIVIGRKFRKCIDPVNKIWQRFSLWTKSPDVEFEDGKDAETKLGMINGITSDLNCEDESIAISASAVRDLSANLQGVSVKWPDYGSATQITPFPQSYTATEDCWFVVSIQRNSITGKGTTFQMFIENTPIDAFSFSDIKENTQDIYISMTRMFPLRQGNTVKFVNDGWKTPRLTVIPCK